MEPNLREQVVQQVRAEIISGYSLPGTMYSVPSLASSLGVSTTPVREALLELARAGLVEPMRNRGFKVASPTPAELENIFNLREVLEIYAVTLVARKPDVDLSSLYPVADKIRQAVEQEDIQLYLEADREFHRMLTDAAGNELLTDMVMSLRDKMRLYGINSRAGLERQAASVAEHFAILDLVGAGNVAGVAELLRQHILSWQPIFLEAMSRTQPENHREPIGSVRTSPNPGSIDGQGRRRH